MLNKNDYLFRSTQHRGFLKRTLFNQKVGSILGSWEQRQKKTSTDSHLLELKHKLFTVILQKTQTSWVDGYALVQW